MKTRCSTLFLLLLTNLIQAQVSFQHATSPANTAGTFTSLNHPQLNGNPAAVVFVSPVWEKTGDLNPTYPIGVRYVNNRWAIYQQNQYALPAKETPRLRFSICFYPATSQNVFVHRVSAGNKSAHISTLDHPQLNGNPNAVLLVTQRFGTYNNHEVGVWYNGSRWTIFNQDRVEMPVTAEFNVLVVASGKAPGLPNSVAFVHTHTETGKIAPPNVGYSVLNHPAINKNENYRVFATQRFNGPYNTHTYNIWYDSPTDSFTKYRDGYWMVFNGQNQPMPVNASFNVVALPIGGVSAETPLWGFADLHAHPASHLAFGARRSGGKNMFWGSPGLALRDAAATMPKDLAPSKHKSNDWDNGDPINNETRESIVKTLKALTNFTSNHLSGGYPEFDGWPHSQNVFHQQMHISWIRRAYDGGMRLMIASVTDNQVLDMLWDRRSLQGGPSPDPNFDFEAAKRQIQFIKELAKNNADWMEVVTTAQQAEQAIRNNRMALILGLEMDKLTLEQTLDLVKNNDVRSVIPIHLTNNTFGGTAAYNDVFNAANSYLNGGYIHVKGDPKLTFRLGRPQKLVHDYVSGAVQPQLVSEQEYAQLGYDCSVGLPFGKAAFCVAGCVGHKNVQGAYKQLLIQLMKEGLLIDLSHMSEAAQHDALSLAEEFKYPVLNSHTGLRDGDSTSYDERAMRNKDARRMVNLGGMLGMGTGGSYEENYKGTVFYQRTVDHRFSGTDSVWKVSLNQSATPQLIVTIRTGGDNLRGNNDNAYAYIIRRDGTKTEFDLNQRGEWGNNSLHSRTFVLPVGINYSDIATFGIRTTLAGGLGGDNWNLDQIKVEYLLGSSSKILLERSGQPFKRFTGGNNGYQNWSESVTIADVTVKPSTTVRRLKLTLKTGGDNLRGNNDNVYAIVKLKNCSQLRFDNLNKRLEWPNHSVNEVLLPDFPVGTQLSDIEGISLKTTFSNGFDNDNWNLDAFRVDYELANGQTGLLVKQEGQPLIRFTGSMQENNWPFTSSTIAQDLPDDHLLSGILIKIRTGSDDLRGDNDNAFAQIELMDGRSLDKIPLNRRGIWEPNSVYKTIYLFPEGIMRKQLKNLVITTTFDGRVASDNWDLAELELKSIDSDPIDTWITGAKAALETLGGQGLALGTDLNGMQAQMPFSLVNQENIKISSSITGWATINLPLYQSGKKTFKIRNDGLAHYGLLPDFLALVAQREEGAPVVKEMYRAAGNVVRMWKRAETAANNVNGERINREVVKLKFDILTGSDNLRGDNDNAIGFVFLRDGGYFEFDLNQRREWANGTRNAAMFDLPSGVRAEDIQRVGVRTTFSGGIASDNWNMNELKLTAIRNGVERLLLSISGSPQFRFTGDQNLWSVEI
ncbi:DUF7452 domain-containing protein [Larkinella sp. GY13]|uniref:DUF7452 domain-containing protein n=1 Tax=Larkinella sp. GY13 TaxID=3453720 RepID=UPI003EEB881E